MDDDITFCMNGWEECLVTRCERHPYNISDKSIPHSFAKLYRTEYCPLEMPKVADMVEGEDSISRRAAIELIERMKPYHQDADDIAEMIANMPSAQPGWIPWNSGRFPEESGTYTVTAYDGATKRVTYAKYQKRLKRWELTGARAYWRVLAWMPRPEPYKGE